MKRLLPNTVRAFFSFLILLQVSLVLAQEPIERIPFRLIDDIIYIKLNINDHKDFNFMFDTGASTTIIGASVGRQLNLDSGDLGKGMGATGTYDTEIFNNNEIELNNLLLKNITLLQTNEALESTVFGEYLDGIIGYDILSKYVVEIDYDNLIISFFEFDKYSFRGQGEVFEFKKFSNIPYLSLSVHSNNKSYTGNYLIDTGAQLEILFTTSFLQKENIVDGLNKYYTLSKNVGISDNTIDLIIGRIDEASVFNHDFKNVPIVTSNINQAVFALTEFDGILGNGILKRFKTIYDYSRNKLYISKGENLNKPFGVDCLGVSFERDYENRILIIESIIPGSAAAKADLQKGDEVLKINGISIKSISNKQLRSFIEADGEMIEFEIQREMTEKRVSFRLKALI